MQNAFLETIDALEVIQKILKENHLYGQCRKQFDIVGDYVGDHATFTANESNAPVRPRGRPRKIKIKEVENEDKNE